jgi:2-oxoglutarate dehydrogenase E1 component
MALTGAWNAEFIDEQYRQWKSDPSKVSRDWQFFFQGFELASARESEVVLVCDEDQVSRQSQVVALTHRYRDLGHLLACLDPLAACPTDHPLLNPAAFNLTDDDLEREFYTQLFPGKNLVVLSEILKALKETYCRSVGVEYMHLQDPSERQWLQERMEPNRNRPLLSRDEKARILNKLYQASLFEEFLHKKYLGQTRFSLEGAEALIPMLDSLVGHVAAQGCREIILGMAHRGRLNVQVNVLEKSYEEIFCEFESNYDPDTIFPVVEGFARARQDMIGSSDGHRLVLPLLIHGDAAFAGQGVVAETLNMSQLEGYSTGGTVHIIINNQIGYTTLPDDARSTRYSTDVAKMLMVPIFHVHGENPESVIHVTTLACDYRMEFGKDVVIDLVCYRRYGHNEGDEPYFTQPQMYERIRERPPLYKIYGEQLLAEKIVSEDEIKDIDSGINERLEASFTTMKENQCVLPRVDYYENWDDIHGEYSHKALKTGVPAKQLRSLARKLNTVPKDFSLHPKLATLLQKRLEAVEKGEGIDWANGEALAFGSLVTEAIPVRLSGQDSRRGTFSQRHSSLVDTKTGDTFVPLNSLGKGQAPFYAYDSLLSEAGVVGFEYGYSLAQSEGLTIWEAQFGDFVNNAQGVIDLYISSGQSKWQRLNGLVLLLPHGFEGMGPEHSSAKLERFLQLCAEENIQVCNPTTPAQYFHLLRRQVKRDFRKPLVVMTPKSLLRHPLAVSRLSDMTSGSFQEVLDDESKKKTSSRILFCSGKIYYELFQRRKDLKATDIGIIRLEQFYPFPKQQLEKVIAQYDKVHEWCWVQEEPENMGGWNFVRSRIASLVQKHIKYIGREAAASPATGFHNIYKREQAAILEKAVGK